MMDTGRQCRLYEQDTTIAVTGQTIRPGGFELTQRIAHLCRLLPEMTIMDIGCGMGASVQYLRTHHHLCVHGIDASLPLLSRGRKLHPSLPVVAGHGESLPCGDSTADGILMECSLSVMKDTPMVLSECYRVLKENGWLAITDIYFRGKDPHPGGEASSACSCVHGARFKDDITEAIIRQGFQISRWEDHTHMLRQLVVDIIWQHGSLKDFMSAVRPEACNCSGYRRLNPGYYLCIARKPSLTRG